MKRNLSWLTRIAALLVVGTCSRVRADLVLHYALDGDYSDRGTSNNAGTPTNGVALTTVATNVMAGAGAATFDGGDNSYVALSNAITFTTGTPWSAAFWAQRGGTANQGMVMGDPSNNNDFIWVTDNFNGFRFRSTGNLATVDFTGPKDQKRHHYALVAPGNGTLSLYIDGAWSANKSAANTGIRFVTVGKAYSNSGYGFKGVLDDVRVYNSVIDAAAVSNLYRLGAAVRYRFEGDFADSGMRTNTATASGNAVVISAAPSVLVGAGSLLLDGEDVSYAALSNALTFAASEAWTAAFWARRPADAGDRGMALGRRDTSSDYVWLNDSLSGLRFCSSSGAALDFSAPKDAEPHHFALAAAGGGALSVFIDGVLTTNVSGADTSFAVDTLGQAYPAASHRAFKGVLDDVYVSPGALDAASVRALCRQGPILALRYAFDADLADSGSYADHGIASGSAAVTSGASVVMAGSGALLLDGDDRSNVRLTTPVSFANGLPWSVTFWARRGETGGQKGMVIGRNQTTDDFIWLNDSFTGLRFRSSAGNTLDFNSPKDVNPHHYALVSEGNATVSFYLDGALVSNAVAVTTSFAIDTVGQAYTTNSLHYGFKGLLDDVRVYTYAVSAATVTELFAQGRTEALHYAFDGDFTDSGAFLNHGTASGAAAISLSTNDVSVGAGALTLDGADSSRVALSSAIIFTNGAPWSAAFWARRGETGGQKGMVLGEASTYANFIWLNDSFSGFRFRSSTTNSVDFTAPKDLANHHYALVASGGGALSLYIDGALSAAKSSAGNTSFLINSVGQAYLTSSHYGFKGVLDDVRVYPYALSAYHVSSLYRQGPASEPAVAATAVVTRVRVILQGGQSNSEGRANPAELPTSPVNLQDSQGDVDFYYSGALSALHPATSGGTQFGPEITCGRRYVDLVQPDASNRVAIVKYSVGGTSLYNDWKAGGDATTAGDGTRYVEFQSMVAGGLAALAAAYPDAAVTLDGMIWMQGESDVTATNSAAYYANLKAFIADVRLTYGRPDLPFVVGRLSAAQTGAGSATYLNAVRQAQTRVADEDPCTGLVDTDGFSLKTDDLHFDAAGQQSLGIAFAERLLLLLERNGTVLLLR